MINNQRNTNKINIILLVLLLSFSLNLILTAALFKSKREYKAASKHIFEENQILNDKLNSKDNTFDKSFDKLYSERLKKLLDEYELTALAQKQWNYILTVNGNNINTKTLYLNDNNVKIVLAEIRNKEDILPTDLLNKGRVYSDDPNDSLISHIKIVSLANYKSDVEKQEKNCRIIYQFNNIPHGTMISIYLSDMLKYRLNFGENLDDNKIELIYK